MSCEILDKNHSTRAKATRIATTATARIVSKSCQMVICDRIQAGHSMGMFTTVDDPDKGRVYVWDRVLVGRALASLSPFSCAFFQ